MLKQHPSGRRRRLRERQLARTTWVNSELWQNISRKCLKDPPSDMLKRGQCWGVCANKDEGGGGGVDILVDLMCRLPGRVNAIRHCKQSLETGNLRLWARACTRTHTPTLSCTVCPAISASHTKTHTHSFIDLAHQLAQCAHLMWRGPGLICGQRIINQQA